MVLISGPKLLQNPNTGLPATEKTILKQNWKLEKVECENCGTIVTININDVFKCEKQSPLGTSVSYNARCPHHKCHKDIFINGEVPWKIHEIPTRTEWLRKARDTFIEMLYSECPAENRQELYIKLRDDDNIPDEKLKIFH
ncbi:MAG TPA: hypothetical protein DF712_15260 [Balneola sp.]|nr:hypothetical protein [Balneola sp.]|tara:strand:+ start:109 stop:531 length:423 start_codon:yes stop_codon:yes gene_type:complete